MTRNAIARPIGETAVLVTMRRGARGPWSVLVDEHRPGKEPLGTTPGFLALVGIASCTIVTVAGVASRGESPLQGMRVAFDVRPGPDHGAVTIHQQTTLIADLTERDRLRLSRAIGHCPVGRDFTKGAVDIEDRIRLGGAVAASAWPSVDLTPVPSAFVPGRVEADYLVDTGEWRTVDGRAVLDQEGEVKAHVESGEAPATRHWGFLGGHSSAGWAPRPSSYAIGALAASTLMTLRGLASRLEIDPGSLVVEVEVASQVPTGGKEASQEAAAAGRPERVRWRRTIDAIGTGAGADPASLERAARLDPLYGHVVRGDLLAGDEIVVLPATAVVPV